LKIKLSVGTENYEKVKAELLAAGFEIDEDADYLLTERGARSAHLSVLNEKGERIHIKTEDIIFLESFGHSVEVHTEGHEYKSTEPLYQLASVLDAEIFLRVSNSVIISKRKIKQIRPSLSMKFVLLMTDGNLVDVTRGYYKSFKEAMGI